MNLLDLYNPYDYSDKKFFICQLNIDTVNQVLPFTVKLPEDLTHLKGLFIDPQVTAKVLPQQAKILGRIVMRFNNGMITPVNQFVYSGEFVTPFGLPQKLDEEIKPGSLMQGYYQDSGKGFFYPYAITIYLIYIKPEKKTS